MSEESVVDLGWFRLGGRVGSGGMGEVYRGVHRPTGREIAIKVIEAEMAARRRFVRMFRREVSSLAQLDHRRIVHLLDAGSTEALGGVSRPYLVMELVDGVPPTERAGARGHDERVRSIRATLETRE
jgi:serine/threonine-protein kinase